MHTSTGVALLMREKKVCEFYFNLGSIFVYQMLKNVRTKLVLFDCKTYELTQNLYFK
ncbi:hypothetical protein F949_00966 [Acinetobacter junii NIPH 182]|nr:hypothetical protein F949_00966 [Acinetobacter junii NIPH 182]